ncbi:hypothetical protein AX17_005492 [Amanita inopinata Kibby_2008]|nr:hypothetical protein AX17_005492 [Amanita inopinata Kibby_2008]
MPSFLSKVFGRRRQDEKDDHASDGVLGERYEAISPTVSPSAAQFPDLMANGGSKEKEKDSNFALFKPRSRGAASEPHQKPDTAPHLALNLPSSFPRIENSTTHALDVVFEADIDSRVLLTDAVIGERRLNPAEALVVVRICAQSISARGLETLGIMHPHWYSSSPDVQRRLISLFIHSLAAKSPSNTLSPSSSAILSTFESEVEYARSPHDVAAVLRWALRHLKLDGNSFGKQHDWYRLFFDAEKTASYPPEAFSDYLAPRVPTTHLDLLCATFEIFSSLAAHAEANGISGSKLSNFFGLWLLTAHRAEEKDDWSAFYARWERCGRMLEHLFLARLRNEAINQRMPVRLMELVQKYPYGTSSPDDDLLPRPRFSTRQSGAVLVRVETTLTTRKPKHNPNQLISDAFEAEIVTEHHDCKQLWETLKAAGGIDANSEPTPGGVPRFGRIFADETIRFLSLLPTSNTSLSASGTSTVGLLGQDAAKDRKRSLSLGGAEMTPASTSTTRNGSATVRHAKVATEPAKAILVAPIDRPVTRDWAQFSASGFSESGTLGTYLAATFLDKDVEVTTPVPRSPSKRSLIPSLPTPIRKSAEGPRTPISPVFAPEQPRKEDQPQPSSSKVTSFSLVQMDEAFVDFWSDAMTDPISSDWPSFVICKLKPTACEGTELGQKVEWVVIERSFIMPAMPEHSPPDAAGALMESRRPTSPRPSVRSQGTFSSAKKRFSLFNTSGARTSLDKKFIMTGRKKAVSISSGSKIGKSASAVRVGEMGEVLREEDEKEKEVMKVFPRLKRSTEVMRKSIETSIKSIGREKQSIEQQAPAAAPSVLAPTQSALQKETDKSDLTAPSAVDNTAISAGAVASSSPDALASGSSPMVEVAAVPELSMPSEQVLVPSPVEKELVQESETKAAPDSSTTTPVVVAPPAPDDKSIADVSEQVAAAPEPEPLETVEEEAETTTPEAVPEAQQESMQPEVDVEPASLPVVKEEEMISAEEPVANGEADAVEITALQAEVAEEEKEAEIPAPIEPAVADKPVNTAQEQSAPMVESEPTIVADVVDEPAMAEAAAVAEASEHTEESTNAIEPPSSVNDTAVEEHENKVLAEDDGSNHTDGDAPPEEQ